MSVTKDAERIGDYGKNLFDLLAQGVQMVGEERDALIGLKDEISHVLVRCHGLFESQDEGGAHVFLTETDRLQDCCDSAIDRLLQIEGENPGGAILTYRYFKRVISHANNIVTSVVVPVDKLDYFDEPKERAEG